MNKPLVYSSLLMLMGCMASLFKKTNSIILFIMVILCVVILFYTLKFKLSLVLSIFFFIGILSFNMYFNFNMNCNDKVRIMDVNQGYCIGKCKNRFLIINGNTKNLKKGEKINLECDFKRQPIYEKGIVGNINIKKYSICKKDLFTRLCEFKDYINNSFLKYLGKERTSSIMSLCFGQRDDLSINDKNNFTKLGIIHIISVSGFHISVIYKMFELIGGIPLGIAVCVIYTIFTGMKASTIRAFIMILILKWSKIAYRNYDKISALSLAFLILLLVRPYYFMDLGFVLSFLATLGIILYTKKIQKKFYMLPFKINSVLAVSFSAQIFTIPYICFTIGNLSVGFLMGNLILIPIYTGIILIGNIGVIFVKSSVLFSYVCNILKVLCLIAKGAIHVLLKITPDMLNVGVKEGIYFIIIYMSMVMFVHGHNKLKYFPLIATVFLCISYYTFFPEVYFVKKQDANCMFLKYKYDCIMMCNYSMDSAKHVIKLKEKFKPNKVITNVKNGTLIKVNNYYIKVNDNKIFIKDNKNKMLLSYDIMYKNLEKYLGYKILFDKVFVWK